MKHTHHAYITWGMEDSNVLIAEISLNHENNVFTYEAPSLNKEMVEEIKNQFTTKHQSGCLDIFILRFKKVEYTSWEAMLKFFEESPTGNIFIFESRPGQHIPDTIRSRMINYKPISKSYFDELVHGFLSCDSLSNRLKFLDKNSMIDQVSPALFLYLIKKHTQMNGLATYDTALESMIDILEAQESYVKLIPFQYKEWYSFISLSLPIINI